MVSPWTRRNRPNLPKPSRAHPLHQPTPSGEEGPFGEDAGHGNQWPILDGWLLPGWPGSPLSTRPGVFCLPPSLTQKQQQSMSLGPAAPSSWGARAI